MVRKKEAVNALRPAIKMKKLLSTGFLDRILASDVQNTSKWNVFLNFEKYCLGTQVNDMLTRQNTLSANNEFYRSHFLHRAFLDVRHCKRDAKSINFYPLLLFSY